MKKILATVTLTALTMIVAETAFAQMPRLPWPGLYNNGWRVGYSYERPDQSYLSVRRQSDGAVIYVSIHKFQNKAGVAGYHDKEANRLTQMYDPRVHRAVPPPNEDLSGRTLGDRFWGPKDKADLNHYMVHIAVDIDGTNMIATGTITKIGKNAKGFAKLGKVSMADYNLLEDFVADAIKNSTQQRS